MKVDKKPTFIISIDDTFCKWEFGFDLSDEFSIEDIKNEIENHFNTKAMYQKWVEATHKEMPQLPINKIKAD